MEGYRRNELPARVFLIDLAGGQKQPWKEMRPAEPLANGIQRLLIARDGGAYVYSTDHFVSELYLVDRLR